ncbi:D-methionine transport system substrate-binding protein [Tissierella praeacuta DSM 18095]|uniref:Lipoprotein n=1 Tax=Tissierella praeacuta DSM 18095 TaxID=1123404 RepID=A0A1M4V9E3_9FIRM|nr:MetQ/NlpA family ABC transporter substrate-binding protein [Tissierella praeacuta]SHE65542.1 D-methionine transport system substrate-binding protein [Tissierella praeacuta DSM 18095]SUP03058.1 29 kDa protein [Tissierella praeacuta]
MKKLLSLTLVVVLALSVVGCSKKTSDENVIKIGVSPDPHAKLVSLVVDDLEKEGIKIEIIEFTDYVKPNLAVNDGEIDANFFQHEPYLNDFKAKEKLNIVSLGKIHVEPMALYSSKYKTIEEIPDGAEIAIPNDTVNGGRALLLLEANGLIKLKDGVGYEATENDVTENLKNLKFTPLEAAFLPKSLDGVDAAIINGNYALEGGLNPVKDGLLIEGGESPYANLIAVRAGEETQDRFVKLLKVLQSEKVKKYIEENYDGAVVPAF